MEGLPNALKIGAPIAEGKDSAFEDRPLESRPSSTSQDRLSRLFPAQPESTLSVASSHHEAKNRYSYPSPLTQERKSAYTISQSPAPPWSSEPTTYGSNLDHSGVRYSRPLRKPSRHRSLLDRIGSIRSPRISKQSKYGKLDDDEEAIESTAAHNRLGNIGEDDYDGDLSGFKGSIAMRTISSQAPVLTKETDDNEDDPEHAGLSTGYHRLEPEGKNGELGGGMDIVIDVPSANRKVAEVSGDILAVAEMPAVDFSSLEGAKYEAQNVFDKYGGTELDAKKSYYFPPDPDMPTWRPFSMRPLYITILIILALGLAGLQEYLCQLSEHRKHQKQKDGLLKFKHAKELSMLQYFTWKYAPIMVLLAYGILWQISDFEVKRLEPYYQLSQKTGATAAESLNLDYLTFSSFLVPLKAIKYRQWAVVWSSVATLLAGSLVPILQNASVQMYPEPKHRSSDSDKFIWIDTRWSRMMSACLVLVALCGALMLYQLRRKSGLLSDPKGVAGIAAMATQSHILRDFQGLDTEPHTVIHKQLKNRRYILHKSSLWQGEYIRNNNNNNNESHEERKPENPHPIILTLKIGIPYICGMLIFQILLPIFMFIPSANLVTEKLPFLLTTIATIVKLMWGNLDCNIRMIEPFYILSRRHAPPRTLTLDYTGTMPGWLPIKAALNGHYLVALVGLGAIMTEVLTVVVSSFSVDGKKFFPGQGDASDENNDQQDDGEDSRYDTDETFKSFWVSFALANGILLSLCIVASIVYLKRRQPFLPRQPGTIASVLAFIHQSKMLLTFVDTQTKNSTEMTRYLESKGKTYALGWFRGRDGEDHCGIDEEEIVAEYKHGFDWKKGRMHGVESWEHF